MALIELIDVTKKFGSHVVLDGVNFALDANERVAVIGKNGGGKSTLMKIIAGLCEIDEGRIITQNGLNIQMLAQTPKFDENLSFYSGGVKFEMLAPFLNFTQRTSRISRARPSNLDCNLLALWRLNLIESSL